MIISGEGGKQKGNKKQHNPAAVTGAVVKQKSLTVSPQKQVKKAPDKLVDLIGDDQLSAKIMLLKNLYEYGNFLGKMQVLMKYKQPVKIFLTLQHHQFKTDRTLYR